MRSPLFSFGLLALSASCVAMPQFHVDFRFDALFPTSQKSANGESIDGAHNLYLSRARVDLESPVLRGWSAFVRLEKDEAENLQLDLDFSTGSSGLPVLESSSLYESFSPLFARAYVQWSSIEAITLRFGRIGAPDIASARMDYQPFIERNPIGSIIGFSGDHVGLAIAGVAGYVGYNFGVWNQTPFRAVEILGDTPTAIAPSSTVLDLPAFTQAYIDSYTLTSDAFDAKSLRLGYGGRVSLGASRGEGFSYGAGVGYNQAPLNQPIVLTTVADWGSPIVTTQDEESPGEGPQYTSTVFNNVSNFALDGALVYGAMQLSAGYQIQTLQCDSFESYNTATTPGQVFDFDGKGFAYWVNLGYLLIGDAYKPLDSQAVVRGVEPHFGKSALEVVLRGGLERRTNALALTTCPGFSDFSTVTNQGNPVSHTSVAAIEAQILSRAPLERCLLACIDNTETPGGDGTQLALKNEVSYQSKVAGWALGLNYYWTENAVLKMEYEARRWDFQRYSASSSSDHSLYNTFEGTLRMRAEYAF